jgi:hypothetical protein
MHRSFHIPVAHGSTGPMGRLSLPRLGRSVRAKYLIDVGHPPSFHAQRPLFRITSVAEKEPVHYPQSCVSERQERVLASVWVQAFADTRLAWFLGRPCECRTGVASLQIWALRPKSNQFCPVEAHCRTISTRRLRARPSSVSFVSTGRDAPKPAVVNRVSGIS